MEADQSVRTLASYGSGQNRPGRNLYVGALSVLTSPYLATGSVISVVVILIRAPVAELRQSALVLGAQINPLRP